MLVRLLAGEGVAANCYLVASEKTRRGLVIDPGVQAERIMAAIQELELSIAWIVLTHAHIDHFSGLDNLRACISAPFAAGDSTIPPDQASPRLNLPGLTFTPYQLPYPPDTILKDGDRLTIDDLELSVLLTPGHSVDSLCLYGHGAVFSGDTLFKGRIGASLPGLFPGYDYRRLKRSIREQLLSLPEETVVYPGHGDSTTIGEELRHNPMLHD
jgi:glyoxylase-like metal-dependent hydrolase (beta-lactamase superfamily II)